MGRVMALAASLMAVAAGPAAARTATPAKARGPARASRVSEIPVSFTVRDINQSKVRCLNNPDGRTYQIKGHLTGTAAALTSRNAHAVTLYPHGHGYGEFFWRFQAVPGYDYVAEQAKRGLISVSFDKLGYGASGIPDGNNVCFGVDATVDHQIISELRSGDYQLGSGGPIRRPKRFSRFALAGHAQGSNSAEVEAYSFNDIQGLVETSLFDAGFTPKLLANFMANIVQCETHPLPEGPGQPSNYQYREPTDQAFIADNFFNADPAVERAATAMRSKDPCGYPVRSAGVLVPVSNALVSTIRVPVHLVQGAEDGQNIGTMGIDTQKPRFILSRDVTATVLRNTGQALTLGRTAPAFRADMAAWLIGHGFGSSTPRAHRHRVHRRHRAHRHHRRALHRAHRGHRHHR